MAKTLNFSYDKEGDILDIAIGKPQKAISEEISEDVFVRLEPKTQRVVGFMILNFEKRFGRTRKIETLPIIGDFRLVKVWERDLHHGSTFTFSLPQLSSKQEIIDLEAQVPRKKEELKPLARPTKEAEEM